MLLKRLKLSNFRQFKEEQEIVFATDETKNVTIVLADNGVGKTTLAQAIQWILYGSIEVFRAKSVLNLKVEQALQPMEQAVVMGEIELVHNDVEYTIRKTQVYKRDSSNNLNSENAEMKISYKKDGQIEFVDNMKITSTIKSILPMAMSKYFFFDGEKIQKMSNEISIGRSAEFSDAVQGLLGLNALKSAMDHLKPNARNSVIGKFNQEIDELGDSKARECRNRIFELNELLEKIENELNENNDDTQAYTREREEKKKLIAEFAEAEKMQNEYNSLEKQKQLLEKERVDKIKLFLNNFNNNTLTFLQKRMISDTLTELDKAEDIDKGIPDVQQDTIKFLLNRKKCICGTDLSDPLSAPVKTLYDEMEFVPPEYLGQAIKSFVQSSKEKVDNSQTFFESIDSNYKDIRNNARYISDAEDKMSDLDKALVNTTKVSEYKLRQLEIERTLENLKERREELIEDRGKYKEEKIEKEADIEKLTLVNERNDKLQMYRDYAVKIYNTIEKAYKDSESNTREMLKVNINNLFVKIYGDGLYVDIDERYKIKVKVNEMIDDEIISMQDIDYSTAQNYSVIFSFIAGIIKMAKENNHNTDNNLVETEVYPLVMDAPLSAFDEKRIKNICDTLPTIARQVIIFIKDTDGKIAKSNLSGNIGKEYELRTVDTDSLLETRIVDVEV